MPPGDGQSPNLNADHAASLVVKDLEGKTPTDAIGVVDQFWKQHHMDQGFNDEWNQLQDKIKADEAEAVKNNPALKDMFGKFHIVTTEDNGQIKDIKISLGKDNDEISNGQIHQHRSKKHHHPRGTLPDPGDILDPDHDGDIDINFPPKPIKPDPNAGAADPPADGPKTN